MFPEVRPVNLDKGNIFSQRLTGDRIGAFHGIDVYQKSRIRGLDTVSQVRTMRERGVSMCLICARNGNC